MELDERNGRLVQGVRVQRVSSEGDGLALHVRSSAGDEFDVHAKQCVLATGIPILDRGGFFARLKPNRSYCMAYQVPGNLTRGMYISADSPTRSVRYAPTAAGDRLIVGGAGHPVGREKHPASSVQELASWARVHYPGALQTHYWSAQDYTPADDLPYVGPILPGNDKIFVATGFDKWGMTNGTAAALALSSRILGGRMEWAEAFASWSPHELSGIPTAMQANLEVGFNLAKGWITPVTRIGDRTPVGGGVVERPPLASGGPQPGERRRAPGVPGVPASRRHRELERCGRVVGVPPARLKVRPGRHPSRGSRHAESYCRSVASVLAGEALRISADPTAPTTISAMPTASGTASETHPSSRSSP